MILSEMGEARWLTPDPSGRAAVDLSNPQSWNAYAYVLNNPATLTDPSGLHGECSSEVSNGNGGSEGAAIPGALDKETQTGTALTNKHHSSNPVNSDQKQNGGEGEASQKASSWDKTKPLPDDPAKLGPDWKKNPDYKNPNGEEYVNDKTGEKVEWNKGRKGPWGPKADRGKDGWHYTPPGGVRGKQMDPGTVLKTAVKTGFWGTAGAITLKIIETAAEACAEGACY